MTCPRWQLESEPVGAPSNFVFLLHVLLEEGFWEPYPPAQSRHTAPPWYILLLEQVSRKRSIVAFVKPVPEEVTRWFPRDGLNVLLMRVATWIKSQWQRQQWEAGFYLEQCHSQCLWPVIKRGPLEAVRSEHTQEHPQRPRDRIASDAKWEALRWPRSPNRRKTVGAVHLHTLQRQCIFGEQNKCTSLY